MEFINFETTYTYEMKTAFNYKLLIFPKQQ